jgi:cell division protein FtsB
MSTTLIRIRVLKKVYEDDVSLNINTGTMHLQLVGLAQSTVLSSFENLALISPSPSHEQDLVSAAVNARLTFEQVADAATSNMSASLSRFGQQLEALKSESTITKKQLEKQDAAVQLLKDDNAHLKNNIQTLTDDNACLKADIQKLNDRIRPLARIALRVFLDAFLAVKGYNPDTSGSRRAWICANIVHLVPNTGISETRFEYLLK